MAQGKWSPLSLGWDKAKYFQRSNNERQIFAPAFLLAEQDQPIANLNSKLINKIQMFALSSSRALNWSGANIL